MRTLVVEVDVLDVALAFGAVVGFGCVVAVIVGALATSKIPTPLPTPQDYYVGRDDLGHEFLVAVPAEGSASESPSPPPDPANDELARPSSEADHPLHVVHSLDSDRPSIGADREGSDRGPAAKTGPQNLPS